MDQTPLPFVLDNGKTYADKGSIEVWCISGSSGLDKQQCSVQLTIFADVVPRVRPLVIFRVKGLKSLGPQSAGCISTKSLVRRINDEKMDIATMGKHLHKPPNNWLNWKYFSC